MRKLLFVLSGNLSTTPRALKIVLSFKDKYDIDIVAINRSSTWLKIDKQIVEQNNLTYFPIDISRKNKMEWLIKTIKFQFFAFFYKLFKKNIHFASLSATKSSIYLHCVLNRKIKNRYNLIYGFSFGSLYPAYKFACRTNTKFIFDIEDYHPGEKCSQIEQKRRKFLMQKILPKASYITYASPLIGEYSLKLLNNYPENRHQLINNCFSETEFQFKKNNSEKIKFVWFSQNISQGRGLELVVPTLAKFKDKIELYLIGNLYEDFNLNFLSKYADFITIHKPLPQKELNLKLSEFDIGLAIEPGKDFNNKIAVSNKIWAYLQSGLYILASDTPAQVKFIAENKNAGIIAGQNIGDFEITIKNILANIEKIRIDKKQRFENAQKRSWENESKKIINIWNNL